MSRIAVQLSSVWRFRETGRRARAVALISTRESDVVVFRFLDNDQTTRKVAARSFLRDFERAA